MSNTIINQKVLKEYFNYDESTGVLTWIKKPSKKIVINSRAGSLNTKTGYRTVYFMGSNFQEHRLIWEWYHSYTPKHQIDHINHIRDDNRIDNLREVTIAENARNRTRRDSRVDESGIWWCKRRKRYIAEIRYNGKKVYQKTFIDIEQAIQERKQKSLELGFHENHGDKKQSN